MHIENITAIHEAGHVVAHYRFGIEQRRATIEAKNDTLGSVLASDSIWDDEDARRQVLCLCAGYASCIAVGLDDGASREGCSLDFEKAEEVIELYNLASIDYWLDEAIKIMKLPENTKAVAVVSSALIKYRTISEGYICALVECADESDSEKALMELHDRMQVLEVTPKTFS